MTNFRLFKIYHVIPFSWLIFHVESESKEKNAKNEVLIFPILNIKEKSQKSRKYDKFDRNKNHNFFTDTYEASSLIKVRGPQGLDLMRELAS